MTTFTPIFLNPDISEAAQVSNESQLQVAISQNTSITVCHGDHENTCLCQSLHPGEPHEKFKSLMKRKTEQLKIHYSKFSENFKRSFMTREECGEAFFDELKVAAEDLFEDDFSLPDRNKSRMLLTKILGYQSYVNFDFLKVIIERCGSENDLKEVKEYTEAYTQYIRERVYLQYDTEVLGKELPGHDTVVFVLDKRPHFKLLSVQDFKYRLSDMLGLKEHQIFLFAVENGSIKVSFQIHMKHRLLLKTIPLFLDRLLFLQQWSTRSYEIQNSMTFLGLEKWRVINSISFCEDDKTNSDARIVPVTYQDKECLTLMYSNKFSNEVTADLGYIDYINAFLSGSYKNLPDVEGIYYHDPDRGLYSYPTIVVKRMKSLNELVSLEQEVSQVAQVSLLLDISSSIASFEGSGRYTVSVFQDSVFVQECPNPGSELTAKFCPLYGHSFFSKHSDGLDAFQSLQLGQLQWMREIVKYIHYKGNSSDQMELPDGHTLKELFKQKWISPQDRFRPKNFKSLCEELKHILGKYFKIFS